MWNLIVSVPDHCLSFYFLWEFQTTFILGAVRFKSCLVQVQRDIINLQVRTNTCIHILQSYRNRMINL